MTRFIDLNGESFKVINHTKSGKYMLESIDNPLHGYNSIFTAYGKPSTRKIGIWESWKQWFDETFTDGQIVICSRNCNFFSIAFKGYINGILYKGYITASRNEVVYDER